MVPGITYVQYMRDGQIISNELFIPFFFTISGLLVFFFIWL